MKLVNDYILIKPDKPKAGAFEVSDMYIDESGKVEGVGPAVSAEIKKLVGKRVIFNAWACDKKKINKVEHYFAPESANVICAVL